MSQIFISYSSKDRSQVKSLAAILEKANFKVWWDKDIPPGARFDRAISKALDQSECILVLWSKNSVESDWVLEEAYEGMERDILLPLMIANTRPPFGYRRIQAIKLNSLATSSTGVKQLLKALEKYQPEKPKPGKKTAPKKRPAKSKRKRRLSGALDGKTFVFTGALSESRRAHTKKVEAVGARMVSAVSSKTDYIVVGKEPGQLKINKARELGIKQISEKKWLSMLNDAYKRILLDKKVVFTGKLELPRTQQEKMARKMGAVPREQISNQTDFLIVGQNPGKTKLDAAKKYSIQIIEEPVWNEILGTL